MSKQQTADFDINALLDGTLDDLADLPEFKPYPAGAHQVKLAIERDDKNKSVFFAAMVYVESKALNNSEDEVPAAGTKTNVRYDLANEFGQGSFKKAFNPVGAQLGLTRIGEIIEALRNPVDALVVTDQTHDKKKDRVYTNILEIGLI